MFQLISSIIALITLTKAISALMLPGRFYGWRSRQYGSEAIPRIVLVLPLLFLLLAATAWYATLFAYQPYGWIVTAFTTTERTVSGLLHPAVGHSWPDNLPFT